LVEEERLLMDIDRSNYSYTFEEYESDVKYMVVLLMGLNKRGGARCY